MSDDPPFLKYFDAEMRYLREAGGEFAAVHPEVARQLGLTTPGARHDNVRVARCALAVRLDWASRQTRGASRPSNVWG